VLNAVQRAGRVAAPRRESLQNQERRRNHNQLQIRQTRRYDTIYREYGVCDGGPEG